uniref:Phosphatidylinositol-4-phosphate 3-kinase catalytic subunit type 2 gamma n=1 Tax=Strix occidentalis caurina TaxID=311401 RepID=A0A8D0G456_STROC
MYYYCRYLVELLFGSYKRTEMHTYLDIISPHVLFRIRNAYPAFDLKTNTGKIWSVTTRFPDHTLDESKFRIGIWTDSSPYPLLLTQHVDNVIKVAKAICSVLCFVETRDITDAVKKLCAMPLVKEQVKDSKAAVTEVSVAISSLIHVYSTSIDVNFQLARIPKSPSCADISLDSQLSFTVYAAHNIPEAWVNRINFPLQIKTLPRETLLTIKLPGVNSASKKKIQKCLLGYASHCIQKSKRLIHGTVLLTMTLYSTLTTAMITPGVCSTDTPTSVTLQVRKQESKGKGFFLTKRKKKHCSHSSSTPHKLKPLLSEQQRRTLWFYLYYCNNQNCSLPLILGSAPSWDRMTVSEMYAVLRRWRFSNPLEVLGLLTSSFPDQDIHRTAVQQIENMSNDELLEYLPQLVQVLKFEWSLESPLVKLLLNCSLQSIQVAHQLYWLLKNARSEVNFKIWCQKLLAALQFCAGKTLNNELSKEGKLIRILEDVAKKLKAASDPKRREVLKVELNRLQQFFQEVKVCQLPLNPHLLSKSCSYFMSNALPLKISFINANAPSGNINVIFNVCSSSDPQFLFIWLQEGLDMQMIIYKCLSTGKGQGLVQMVPDATTLAKIHRESGLIEPLKENTIKKWFHHHHPLESSYQEAIRNFFYSCAGCDNVMLTNAGHMFYIDFGRFLGHTQTFGSIRRDRAPFIFTSEMEYFITEGGKNPQHFQEFVELCCQAYNIVRKHSYRLTIFLYFKMLHAGLPELNSIQDLKYMYDNLCPQDSDLQATSYFTGFGNSLSHSRHSMRKISPCQSLSCANMGIHIYDHFIFQRLPDGSAPSAHAEFYLLSDPTYNEIVVYDKVTELKGRILKLVVKSKGAFMGAVNIQLSSVQLNEEKWYPLGNSVI